MDELCCSYLTNFFSCFALLKEHKDTWRRISSATALADGVVTISNSALDVSITEFINPTWTIIDTAVTQIRDNFCCGADQFSPFMDLLDGDGRIEGLADVMRDCANVQLPSINVNLPDMTWIDDVQAWVEDAERQINGWIADALDALDLDYTRCCDPDMAFLMQLSDIVGSGYNLATCACSNPNPPSCLNEMLGNSPMDVIMDAIGNIPAVQNAVEVSYYIISS